jgi:hypothetical protein
LEHIEQASTIGERFSRIRPLLNEVQRRYWVAIEAQSLGRGGLSLVAAATGVSQPMIRRGLREVQTGSAARPEPMRQRRPGGGRKSLLTHDVHLLDKLLAQLEPPGRRQSLLWSVSSAAELAERLTAAGHQISAQSVSVLLRQRGYTLRATRAIETPAARKQYTERYRYLGARVAQFTRCGQPVLYVQTSYSVDPRSGQRPARAGLMFPELILSVVRCCLRQHAPLGRGDTREALLVLDAELRVPADFRRELKRTAQALGNSLQLVALPPAIHRFRSLHHQMTFSAESTVMGGERQGQTTTVSLASALPDGPLRTQRQQLYRSSYPDGLITPREPSTPWSLSALK